MSDPRREYHLVGSSRSGPKAGLADRISRTLLAAVIVSAVLGLLLLSVIWVLRSPAPDLSGGSELVVIEPGMSLVEVAQMLNGRRLINHPTAFRLAARLMGVDRKIRPGAFLIGHGASNTEVLRLLLKPMVRTNSITIPEGLSVREIAGLFHTELGFDSSEFVAVCNDTEFAYVLNIPAPRLEGYLFPDTYDFYQDTPVRGVIERMVDRFFEVIGDSLQIRIRAAGMSLHEAVTLASIIEGEVQLPEEATLVSAVYHNRLRKGMALEADPTIQYVIPDGPRRLLRSDLFVSNPYNTYRNPGLPPGPINNPGLRSIRAAIHPEDVDYLYFVSQGDGSHAFNTSYEGHLASKLKLDKLRKDLERERESKLMAGTGQG